MIWGASGGIGRSLSEQLKADGWKILAVVRHRDDIEDLISHPNNQILLTECADSEEPNLKNPKAS